MAMVKRLLTGMLIGAGLGAVGALLIAPRAIAWYSTPAIPNITSCEPSVVWALDRLRESLLISSAVLGVIAAVIAQVIHVRRARTAAVSPSSASTKPS